MKRVGWLLGWIGLLGLIDGASANDAAEADRAAVLATTQAWIAAFNTRDAERIAALYAPDAVFWGTVSKTIRTTPEAVVEYFRDSAKRRPKLRMELVESHVRVLGDIAINSGGYRSTDPTADGDVVTPLRFTFVYRREAGRWAIIDHHSSRMP